MEWVKEKKGLGAGVFQVIALDGGAASGKSSTARMLAEQLNFLHCDSGEHYRALTYCMLEAGVPAGEAAVVEFLNTLNLGTAVEGQSAHIVLNGQRFSAHALKSPGVNGAVSAYAALPCVRSWLLDYQRSQVQLAQQEGFEGLIMEGRDIGSVVFPKASFAFFLEADAATRQSRRDAQGAQDSIVARDTQDASRPVAPLLKSPRALEVNTARMSLEEVVSWMRAKIEA